MKKRILSILLAAAMIIPMIIMPTSAVEPAASEWTWNDEFARLDGRNFGQYKFDVGAAETKGVVVDGKIDANDNYTLEQVWNWGYHNQGQNVPATEAHPDVIVRMARKGAHLYLSLQIAETAANYQDAKVQLGMAVSKNSSLSSLMTRAETWLKNDRAEYKSLTYFGGPAGNDTANNPGYSTNYIIEYKKVWAADAQDATKGLSTYEMKIDIAGLALMTTATKTSDPVTEVKILQMMFFYYYKAGAGADPYYINMNAAWNNANNPYKKVYTAEQFCTAIKKAQTPEHTYGVPTSGGYASPIAFGGETIQLVHTQEPIGAVGTDVRNIEEGHLITIPSISEKAPIIDGVIGEDEYTVKNKKFEFKTDSNKSFVNVNLAYKDGYIYIAAVTTEAAATNTQLDMNAMPIHSKYSAITINRLSQGVKANGDLPGAATGTIKVGASSWISQQTSADAKKQDIAMVGSDYTAITRGAVYVVDAANKSNGVDQTVYEYKVSAALLAEYWGRVYNVPSGISIFGFQIWTHGVTNQNAMNDTGSAKRKTVDMTNVWGLDWGLYTIQTPEATDAYLSAHQAMHQRSLSMTNGASARINADPVRSGLRFKTTFSTAYLAQIKEAAGDEELIVGTIIAPRDYVTATGSFTMEALDAKYGEGKGYVNVVADLDTPYASADGSVTIAGSITNIKDGNITRDFAAIAYVKYGDTILYSSNYVTRNVYEIVAAAVKDASSYTAEELAVLEAQLAAYDEILAK